MKNETLVTELVSALEPLVRAARAQANLARERIKVMNRDLDLPTKETDQYKRVLVESAETWEAMFNTALAVMVKANPETPHEPSAKQIEAAILEAALTGKKKTIMTPSGPIEIG